MANTQHTSQPKGAAHPSLYLRMPYFYGMTNIFSHRLRRGMPLALASLLFVVLAASPLRAQQWERWQQHAAYDIRCNFEVKDHTYTGSETIVYTNNSPDALGRLFFHLFPNAFQPGSMMIEDQIAKGDPNDRIDVDEIMGMTPDQYGRLLPTGLTLNGQPAEWILHETILEVPLETPLAPGAQLTIEMDFEGQVPTQVRRSGRNSAEGIDYSMTQWFPKLAEYDHLGWHPNPYIGGEFHGVWGDFDLHLTIDKDYVVSASGILQNPQECGYGYAGQPMKPGSGVNKGKLTWHFRAENVHDCFWAADRDYTHVTRQVPGGPELHFFYQPGEATAAWDQAFDLTVRSFQLASEYFGQYPYPVYHITQGGDSGMEYAMGTLITGNRNLRSLMGVTVHEHMHSWFQHVLASNEPLHPWMDEGFTSYATAIIMAYLFQADDDGNINWLDPQLHRGALGGYFYVVQNKLEEPLNLHSDMYLSPTGYGIAAYSKGELLLHQLSYIIGIDALRSGMLRYFDTWKFKHPYPDDFFRIMEKESGMVLDWYQILWTQTTRTIDYNVTAEATDDGKTRVILQNVGTIPMPQDVFVLTKSGELAYYYVPLGIQYGSKPNEFPAVARTELKAWAWTSPEYSFVIDTPFKDIEAIELDPTKRMADVYSANNVWKPRTTTGEEDKLKDK